MPSAALSTWQGDRRERLAELYAAHRSVGGVGRGRRTTTVQLNWALALRLAGEFQGYARDLHDQATRVLASTAPTPALESVLAATFALERKLDRGNANRATIQQDFRKLGIPILDRIVAMDRFAITRLDALDELNVARNAIAHSQPARLTPILAGVPTLRLDAVSRWDRALRGLATTMDNVVGAELAALTGGTRPW